MQVFNPSQISLAQLLNEARANRGKISHIYLHWTAGRYNQFFDDYHLNIDGEGKVAESRSGYTDGGELHLIEKVRELLGE